MPSVIESELHDKLGLAPQTGKQKDRTAYLAQLCSSAASTCEESEDKWDTLSEGAQNWINSGVDALNDEAGDGKVAEFPDYTAPKPAAKANGKGGAKKGAAKEKKPRKKAGVTRLKEIMLQKPDIEWEALGEQLKKEGVELTANTLRSFHNDMRNTIAVLKDKGFYPKPK